MFTNKQIGILLIVIGIVVSGVLLHMKIKEDFYVEALIQENNGVCVLENDYCLHNDRNWTGYIIGWLSGGSLIILGAYLLFFEKSYEYFNKERKEFVRRIEETKLKDEFQAFLSGFSQDEQAILKCIHAQEGIKQSTLRFKVGMSKATLSLLLSSLEKRNIISRKVSGKSKEVYLIKTF